MKPRILHSLFALLMFGLVTVSAHAQTTFTWSGLGADDNISNGANWVGGVAPAGTSGLDDLFFNDPAPYTPTFTASFIVHDITFGPMIGSNNLTYTTGTVTVNGNLTTQSGSQFGVLIGVPMNFSAGLHNIVLGTTEITGADIYLFNQLGGSGDLAKYGGGALIFDHSSPSTMTGTIDLLEGEIRVHNDGVLGTGLLKMDGGSIAAIDYYTDTHTTTLTNNLSLSEHANFGSSGLPNGSLIFTGTATAQSGLALNTVYMNVNGNGLLTLNNVAETTAGTIFRYQQQGTTRIAGAATYTGGTQAINDSVVVFANSAPVTGLMTTEDNAYIGVENNVGVQANFLARFDAANTLGIIGFDSPSAASPVTFSENLDFSAFNQSTFRFGTSTAAIVTGTITPHASTYRFGGRGVLTVGSNLTGASYDVEASDGLMLVLNGTNTYSGHTRADSGAAVVFDGAMALPASTLLYSTQEGYVGQTENTGRTAAQFIAFFDTFNTAGVIGFDAHDPVAGRTVSDNLDLSTFTHAVVPYLGTATNVTLTGTITPSPDFTYRLTGFRDGHLTVNSVLSGSNFLYIGLRGDDLYALAPANTSFHPSVTLNGANTFDRGTYLESGDLILGHNSALGSALFSIDNRGNPVGLSVNTGGLTIANNIDFNGYGNVTLDTPFDYTLSGNLTGSEYFDKVGLNALTLSGNNSSLFSGIQIVSGIVRFISDTAAGVGSLSLRNFDGPHDAQAIFTSANPVMGSLYGDDRTTLNLGTGTLTMRLDRDSSFDGQLVGTGNIIVNIGSPETPPTLTLNGHNTGYTGTTTLVGGSLAVTQNDSLGSGAIVFNGGRLSVGSGVTISNPVSFGASGGILGGNGIFGGSVSIGSNAHLAPGNSVGLLSFTGGMTWAPTGSYDVEVQSAVGARGAGYDSIDVTGGLTFNATLGSPFTVNLISLDTFGSRGLVTDFDSGANYAWFIAHADGLSGFDPANITIDSGQFTNGLAGGVFNVSTVGNDIYLNFTAVPEPSTYALLALGFGAVFLRRRKVARVFQPVK